MRLRYVFGFGVGMLVTVGGMAYGAVQPGASVRGVLLIAAIGIVAVPAGVFLASRVIDHLKAKGDTGLAKEE
jgi:hypothetical protein